MGGSSYDGFQEKILEDLTHSMVRYSPEPDEYELAYLEQLNGEALKEPLPSLSAVSALPLLSCMEGNGGFPMTFTSNTTANTAVPLFGMATIPQLQEREQELLKENAQLRKEMENIKELLAFRLEEENLTQRALFILNFLKENKEKRKGLEFVFVTPHMLEVLKNNAHYNYSDNDCEFFI